MTTTDLSTVDLMFEAARQIGERIAEERACERQAAKNARNVRRRAAYARQPQSALSPVSTAEEDWEAFCRCYVVAPCGFCESGGAS